MLILKLWKRENDDILSNGSPYETLGFSKEKNYLQMSTVFQNFLIKKYDFSSIKQVPEIKKQLQGRNILIINAETVLNNNKTLEELKEAIEELKGFLKKCGGSIGRIGDHYLILTPSSSIKIANKY